MMSPISPSLRSSTPSLSPISRPTSRRQPSKDEILLEQQAKENEAKEKKRAEEDAARAAKMESKRQHALAEVVSSEEKYCECLSMLTEYVKGMREKQDMLDVGEDDIQGVFSNIELLANFHRVFLGSLKANKNCAAVFLKEGDFLKMYIQFVNHYSDAMKKVDKLTADNKAFVTFLDEQRARNGLGLMSLLIMPVQR